MCFWRPYLSVSMSWGLALPPEQRTPQVPSHQCSQRTPLLHRAASPGLSLPLTAAGGCAGWTGLPPQGQCSLGSTLTPKPSTRGPPASLGCCWGDRTPWNLEEEEEEGRGGTTQASGGWQCSSPDALLGRLLGPRRAPGTTGGRKARPLLPAPPALGVSCAGGLREPELSRGKAPRLVEYSAVSSLILSDFRPR